MEYLIDGIIELGDQEFGAFCAGIVQPPFDNGGGGNCPGKCFQVCGSFLISGQVPVCQMYCIIVT